MIKLKQNDILYLCQKIAEKPGAYIGIPSVTRLRAFLDGYIYACCSNDISISKDNYSKFNSWIEEKYDIKKSVLWDTFLLDITHNEEKAFNLFVTELKKFLTENDSLTD